jgi:hypothetical protein
MEIGHNDVTAIEARFLLVRASYSNSKGLLHSTRFINLILVHYVIVVSPCIF